MTKQKLFKNRFALSRTTATVLKQKRIYILPTALSLAMFGLVVLLFVLGNLFQNTMAYSVSFWLFALQAVSILYTFRNLHGVTINATDAPPCFAGDTAHLHFRLGHEQGRAVHNVSLGWPKGELIQLDIPPKQTTDVQLSYPTSQRGLMQPAKMLIQTRFPTGFACAWGYLLFDTSTIVYPTPRHQMIKHSNRNDESSENATNTHISGSSELHELRDYQQGDSPKRIHWAKYAKTGQLYTKTLADYPEQERWLRWNDLTGDTEQKLSALCEQVLEADSQKLRYGVELPSQSIKPNDGNPHKLACLRALALFEIEPTHV